MTGSGAQSRKGVSQTQPEDPASRMDSMFLNRLGAAFLLSGVSVWICSAVGSAVVPQTVPARPAFSLPGLENKPIAPFMAHADAERGDALVHQVCTSCHAVNEGASDGVGPNLSGVAGRRIAGLSNYSYSAALKGQQGHVWSDQALSDWLTSPARFAPGTRMSLVGLPDPAQRADIIAYLHTLGDAEAPAPSPDPKVTP